MDRRTLVLIIAGGALAYVAWRVIGPQLVGQATQPAAILGKPAGYVTPPADVATIEAAGGFGGGGGRGW